MPVDKGRWKKRKKKSEVDEKTANPKKRLSSSARELNMSDSGGRVKPLTAESDGHTTHDDGSRGVPAFPRAVAPTQKEFPWQLSTPALRPRSWDGIVGGLVILVIGGHREGRCRSGGPPGRDGARPGSNQAVGWQEAFVVAVAHVYASVSRPPGMVS